MSLPKRPADGIAVVWTRTLHWTRAETPLTAIAGAPPRRVAWTMASVAVLRMGRAMDRAAANPN